MKRAICDEHSRYRAGCAECARRSSRYYNDRARAVTITGSGFSRAADLTSQRIWELRANGWSLIDLGARSGVDWHHLSELCRKKRYGKYVTLRMFDAVEKTYRELRDFPGPSTRARTWAAKSGHVPPELAPVPSAISEAHVDDVAVDRALRGERVPLTRAELTAAWRELERRGYHANEIARRLHVAERTVQRWRDQGVATNYRRKASRAS